MDFSAREVSSDWQMRPRYRSQLGMTQLRPAEAGNLDGSVDAPVRGRDTQAYHQPQGARPPIRSTFAVRRYHLRARRAFHVIAAGRMQYSAHSTPHCRPRVANRIQNDSRAVGRIFHGQADIKHERRTSEAFRIDGSDRRQRR